MQQNIYVYTNARMHTIIINEKKRCHEFEGSREDIGGKKAE